MSNKNSIHAGQSNRDVFICPVCNASSGRSGLFVDDWAVACHVAGKARTGDRLHKSWALTMSPNLDLGVSLLKTADRLLWAVRKARTGQETLRESPQDEQGERLYSVIRELELRLHEFIELRLKREFGDSEDGWWVKGIPMPIRQECVKRREEDTRRQEPYRYTDVLDLQRILDKNWALFEADFRHIAQQCKSKKEFLDAFVKFNGIRNVIMHPVRQPEEIREDIQFLNWFHDLMNAFLSDD